MQDRLNEANLQLPSGVYVLVSDFYDSIGKGFNDGNRNMIPASELLAEFLFVPEPQIGEIVKYINDNGKPDRFVRPTNLVSIVDLSAEESQRLESILEEVKEFRDENKENGVDLDAVKHFMERRKL